MRTSLHFQMRQLYDKYAKKGRYSTYVLMDPGLTRPEVVAFTSTSRIFNVSGGYSANTRVRSREAPEYASSSSAPHSSASSTSESDIDLASFCASPLQQQTPSTEAHDTPATSTATPSGTTDTGKDDQEEEDALFAFSFGQPDDFDFLDSLSEFCLTPSLCPDDWF